MHLFQQTNFTGRVRLLSCLSGNTTRTGNPFAQQLADALGREATRLGRPIDNIEVLATDGMISPDATGAWESVGAKFTKDIGWAECNEVLARWSSFLPDPFAQ